LQDEPGLLNDDVPMSEEDRKKKEDRDRRLQEMAEKRRRIAETSFATERKSPRATATKISAANASFDRKSTKTNKLLK